MDRLRVTSLTLVAAVLAFTPLAGQETSPKPDPEGVAFFEKQIRPILHAHCIKCHGPEKQKAGLRLDSRGALLKGGDSGPAVLLGDPGRSLLLKAVRQTDPDLLMPPPKSGKKLPDAVLRDFETWVKAGAPFPASAEPPSARHWAFQPLGAPPVPAAAAGSDGARTSVDAFVLAQLRTAGATLAPGADRRTLIRRATYDLTGLPPNAEEVDAFVQDGSPDATAKLIDRLLDSPAYGECWGRKWLDVVRYADSAGENSDFPSPQAWRYRNYVIDAFNRDKPYDQFIREQVAGDLLAKDAPPERYAELITATGYLAVARRFGHDIDHDMHLTREDVIDTLGKSVLGLTLGCARCHNHKYDPVTARDYYALYGIFASTRFPFPGCEAKQAPRDLVPLEPPVQIEARLKPWRDEQARLDAEVKRLDSEVAALRKALGAAVTASLGSGELPPGGEQSFRTGRSDVLKSWVNVKAGEMLQFSLFPRANHGADSTLVELEISEQGGQQRVWNLTRDMVADFFQDGAGAQHSDGQGNPNVWQLYDLVPAPTLLSVFVKDADKTPGLHYWRGPAALPAAFVNARDETLCFSTVTMPPRSFALHPGPNGPVALAWQSPIDGAVVAAGRVAKLDPGGDGVAWKLDLRAGIGRGLADQKRAMAAVSEARKQRDLWAARKPATDGAYAVTEGRPADAPLQNRGEPDQPGDLVPRRNLEMLGGQAISDPAQSGRLDLARWLTDPKNPLTARVMANRIWQGHFGRGLVSTPNDFGTRGANPTHPELLDHLATAFIAGGWSMKSLHRLIMLSAAYQCASEPGGTAGSTVAASERSLPGAEYARFPRRRLDAEEIRDSLLVAGGELDRSPGQGHPFPPEETWKFTQHNPFKAVYDSKRRSVYLMIQRIQRHPFLGLFDGPDPNASTARRDVSTVPTQALYFLNDPFFHARAESLAKELLALPRGDRVAAAHRRCFQRAPREVERQDAESFLEAYRAALGDGSAEKRELAVWSAYARTLLGSNEFLYVD